LKLQKLHIKNYKSLVDLEIVEPNPFTVFAGPNGAGKSNIFEALEFATYGLEWKFGSAIRLFGGAESIYPRSLSDLNKLETEIIYDYDSASINRKVDILGSSSKRKGSSDENSFTFNLFIKDDSVDSESFIKSNDNHVLHIVNFNRIFIKNADLVRVKEISNQKLGIDCSNLEKVLKRLLEDEIKREDITEYLDLFIPGFERIEIDSNNLSGTDTLLIYEMGIDKPFTKDLISDGTYNILCLLTAVFQSDEPQFLCIEEPENGLNPHVIETFVELFRSICEDKGHYIWLNTHSQTLIRGLKEEELVLVDKEEGATKIKQFRKGDFYGLRADEAWLSNALGAGLPW